MAWIRIDENFAQHPKVVRAGPLGMALHVAALGYCNRYLTDGFVPKQVASLLLDFSGLGMRMWDAECFGGGEDATWELVVEDIVDAGLWETTEAGWLIHDYLDYQPSKEQVLGVKKVRKEAGGRGGKAPRKQSDGANAKQTRSKRGSKRGSKIEAKTKPNPNSNSNLKKDSHPSDGGHFAPDGAPPTKPDPVIQAFGLYNALAERIGLPQCAKVTNARRASMRKRLEDAGGLDGWKHALAIVEGIPGMRGASNGSGHDGWRCSIDFLLREGKFAGLMEGRYDDWGKDGAPTPEEHEAAWRRLDGEDADDVTASDGVMEIDGQSAPESAARATTENGPDPPALTVVGKDEDDDDGGDDDEFGDDAGEPREGEAVDL